VKKLFYVLTDDKVGSGPRLRPGVLAKKDSGKEGGPDQEMSQPMETDGDGGDTSAPPSQPTQAGLTLSAKLALKRKASEPAGANSGSGSSKAKRQ
jgi:hypothetical protein